MSHKLTPDIQAPTAAFTCLIFSNMPWCRPNLEFLLSKVPFAVDGGCPARGTLKET